MKKVHKPVHTLLFGFHRTGSALLETIQNMKKTFSVIDFDPQVIYELAESGISSVYGDAGDENFLEDVQTDKAKLIISTIPDVAISSTILTFLRLKKFTGTVIVSARTHEEAERCYELGAAYVIVPSILSGKKMSELLEKTKLNKALWKKHHEQTTLNTL
ncbi:hypothetical protein A3H12_00910 [Candidatus Uhrbacteria bacterium RIFCSPLOWO2_12_FULL_47_9]|nr:MAG: hypothetical protein A3H12_00910 [Candidatus Uhrbacteria bacterium RIFCSPLOWO2_12_FULL_47_9]